VRVELAHRRGSVGRVGGKRGDMELLHYTSTWEDGIRLKGNAVQCMTGGTGMFGWFCEILLCFALLMLLQRFCLDFCSGGRLRERKKEKSSLVDDGRVSFLSLSKYLA
jgi:hypothetical protein